MNLRALLLPDSSRREAITLLIIRVAVGLLLVPHGYIKAASGGAAGIAGLLAGKGVPGGILLAWCAVLSELVGGTFFALGLLTRPAAVAIAITMLVAVGTVHLGDISSIGTGKGVAFEYPFLLSVIAIAFAFSGPGRFSLDALLVRRLK